MDLTATTRVELLVNPTGSAGGPHASVLGQIITGVSNAAEQFMNRKVLAEATTEYFDVAPYQKVFRLKAFPVTAVTSVAFDLDQAWGSTTLLTATTDYWSALYEPRGVLEIRYALNTWDDTYGRALKVVYTGGMAATAAAFIAAFPDISNAIDQQVAYFWHQRNNLGVTSITSEFGTSVNMMPTDWLPAVRSVLERHKRQVAA